MLTKKGTKPNTARALAVASALAFFISACSAENGADTSTDGSSASGDTDTNVEGVTFQHPTIAGLNLEFEKQPEHLVMDCYAYSALEHLDITPDAVFGYDCDNPWVMGDTDISEVEQIGKDGEIDMEKLAQLRPDAVIGHGDADGWSWFDDDVNKQLTSVTTFIPLPDGDSIEENLDGTEKLGEFLGADLSDEKLSTAREDFKSAKEDFSKAVEGKELDFMLTSPTKEMLYTAVGFNHANFLEELGANIVGAQPPAEGNPWGKVAWEEASSYPADVILVEGLDEQQPFSAELWDSLPAVENDQLAGWSSKGAMTYYAFAKWLQGLAQQVKEFDKLH